MYAIHGIVNLKYTLAAEAEQSKIQQLSNKNNCNHLLRLLRRHKHSAEQLLLDQHQQRTCNNIKNNTQNQCQRRHRTEALAAAHEGVNDGAGDDLDDKASLGLDDAARDTCVSYCAELLTLDGRKSRGVVAFVEQLHAVTL